MASMGITSKPSSTPRVWRERVEGPPTAGPPGGLGRGRDATGRGRPSPLPPLEVAGELPVGDGGVVEDDLLLLRGVQQVIEHEVAESLAGYLPPPQLLHRL